MSSFCLIELIPNGERIVSGSWNEDGTPAAPDASLPPPAAILTSPAERPRHDIVAVLATWGKISDDSVTELATKLRANGCKRVVAVSVDDLIAIGNSDFVARLPCVEFCRERAGRTLYALHDRTGCLARGERDLDLYARPEQRRLAGMVQRVRFVDDVPAPGWASLERCASVVLRQQDDSAFHTRIRIFVREDGSTQNSHDVGDVAAGAFREDSPARSSRSMHVPGTVAGTQPLLGPVTVAFTPGIQNDLPISRSSSDSSDSLLAEDEPARSSTPWSRFARGPLSRKQFIAIVGAAVLLMGLSGAGGFLFGHSLAAERTQSAPEQIADQLTASQQRIEHQATQIANLVQELAAVDSRLKAMEQHRGDEDTSGRRLTALEARMTALIQTPSTAETDIQSLREAAKRGDQDRTAIWEEVRRLSSVVAYLRSKLQ